MLPSWLQNLPDEPPKGTGLFGEAAFALNKFGRNQFISSYAAGGYAAYAFAPTARQRMSAAFSHGLGRSAEVGSEKWVNRMNALRGQAGMPSNAEIDDIIAKKTKNYKPGGGALGTLGKVATGVGFIAPAAIGIATGEGALGKAQGATAGIANSVGFVAGSFTGRIVGAAIGTALMPGLGSIVGGIAGGFIAESPINKGFEIAEKIVKRERKRRAFEWGQHNPAFDTQRAHTMRQQSLSMMNRGQNTARSLMGREAVALHQ